MDLLDLLRTRLDRHGRTVLEIDLSRGLLTAAPDSPLEALRAWHAPSLRALRDALRAGAADDRVLGLIVSVGDFPLGLSVAQELVDLIGTFAEHKPTATFAESFGELSPALSAYTLASRTHQIWLQPSGGVHIGGVHLDITLVRGLLEKAGLEPQFGQRHEYKSAADQLAATEITPANVEMMQRLADSIVEQCVRTISTGRSLPMDQVRALIDQASLTPQEALDQHLIDHIGYRDEAYAQLLSGWRANTKDLRFAHRYGAGQIASKLPRRHAGVVGVVQVRGPIVTGRGRGGGARGGQAGGDVVAEHLRAAARDERVKALVLRVDSPGGSAVASDTIWRAVHQVRESGIPVVASMGAVAASGGYYVSMAAQEIVALPGTLTGSIGVLAGKIVSAGLYDKLGLKRAGIDAGAHAGMLSSSREFDEADWRTLNAWLDRIYEQFTTKAAADRGMDIERLEPLARGRVWTGADALERGLIDHVGGMEVAIDRACALAGLRRDEAQLRGIPTLGPLDRFLPAESSESGGGANTSLATTPERLLSQGLSMLGYDPAVVAGPVALPWRISLG